MLPAVDIQIDHLLSPSSANETDRKTFKPEAETTAPIIVCWLKSINQTKSISFSFCGTRWKAEYDQAYDLLMFLMT